MKFLFRFEKIVLFSQFFRKNWKSKNIFFLLLKNLTFVPTISTMMMMMMMLSLNKIFFVFHRCWWWWWWWDVCFICVMIINTYHDCQKQWQNINREFNCERKRKNILFCFSKKKNGRKEETDDLNGDLFFCCKVHRSKISNIFEFWMREKCGKEKRNLLFTSKKKPLIREKPFPDCYFWRNKVL